MRSIALFAILLCCCVSERSRLGKQSLAVGGSPHVDLNFQEATISPAGPAPYQNTKIDEDGLTHVSVEEGYWHDTPSLLGPKQYCGQECLESWGGTCTACDGNCIDSCAADDPQKEFGLLFHSWAAENNDNERDKMLVTVVHRDDSWALANTVRRYMRFKVRIEARAEAPTNFTLIAQVWQLTTAPLQPPFGIYVRPEDPKNPDPDGPIILDFSVRDDATLGADPLDPDDDDPRDLIYSLTANRDQWYSITLQLQPSHNADASTGQLAIWVDTDTTGSPVAVWYEDWSYEPALFDAGGEFIADKFDVEVGIYRRKQARRMRVAFDDLQWANNAGDLVD